MEIDHDPNEPDFDRTRGPWRVILPILALATIANVYLGLMNWPSFIGGVGVGAVLAAWAIEVTGNKIPESWRNKTARGSGRSPGQRGNDPSA